jgi:hypothetical protein
MALVKSLLVFLFAGNLAIMALLYVAQRALMYFPERLRTAPAAASFAGS